MRRATPTPPKPCGPRARLLGEQEKEREPSRRHRRRELRDLLLRIPNLPAADAPDGATEPTTTSSSRVEASTPTATASTSGCRTGRSAPSSGSSTSSGGRRSPARCSRSTGAGAPRWRGRCASSASIATPTPSRRSARPRSCAPTPWWPPASCPKFADDAYHLERDDLWAIPTAEVPLTSIGRDEILAEADLPMRLMAYTPCFRREAGSAGRDTRGLLRVHEFDKVEILAYATPEQAPELHAEIVARAEAPSGASASPTGCSTSAPATSGRATTARTTSRSTRPAATSGWRCRRSRGSATTRPAGPTSATARPTVGHRARAHAQRLGPRRAAGVGGGGRDLPPARRHDRGADGPPALPRRN